MGGAMAGTIGRAGFDRVVWNRAPSKAERVADAVDRAGAAYLDCPVSGSVSLVEAGTLTIMAGGDAGALELARPVLDALASRVIHVGARGTGSAAKLAVNDLVLG